MFKDIFGGGATCYIPDPFGGEGLNVLCLIVGVAVCVVYLAMVFRNRINRVKKGYEVKPLDGCGSAQRGHRGGHHVLHHQPQPL